MARDYRRQMTNAMEMAIDGAINSGVTYTRSTLKKKFGKEFNLQYENNSGVIKEVVSKFIQKYDKKFNDHVQKSMVDTPCLINTQYIIFLEKGTYCYIASGNKIGNTEERFLMSNNISTMDLYIYIFGKKMYKYANELEKIIQYYLKNDELGLFNVSSESGGRYMGEDVSESLEIIYSKLATRSLDTMFFSHGEKEAITSHIEKFLGNEEFYKEKQILFKTGILLYGKPGTGKSSLVKALATTYNRSIVNINVGKLVSIDLNKLTSSINVDDTRKYIILLEDIDTLFLNRKDSQVKGNDDDDDNTNKRDKEDNIIINKLLQFLDSNSSPTNVIFIATTNHKERLDEALLREGRFDLKVDCMNLDKNDAIKFGKSFRLDEANMLEIIDEIDKENMAKGKSGDGYNQSKLQARILSRLTNKTLDHIEKTICVDTDVTGNMGEESETDNVGNQGEE